MAIERTLSIIKPDAVAKNVIGQIYSRFEGAGLKVVAARMVQLSRAEAEGFYAVHRERPFFKDLVDFMVSGPVMIQVLEGEGAILKIAISWARLTLRKLKKALFVRILQTVSMQMLFMVPMLLKLQQLRLHIFSLL
jgi:hypothetical protein